MRLPVGYHTRVSILIRIEILGYGLQKHCRLNDQQGLLRTVVGTLVLAYIKRRLNYADLI